MARRRGVGERDGGGEVKAISQVTDYLARIGAKGGKATGASKRRGDSAHYKRISKLAAKARKAK